MNTDTGIRRIHVVPIGDKELHAAQEICWCHPTESEPRLWVHNAIDCRDAKERATGEKCSDGWINVAEFIAPNDSLSLLRESRECIAACFRVIAGSDDQMIMDRLELQLALAGVKNGIGVRLQNFIAYNQSISQ